ncbi:hypothetical protein SDC9_178742 [bioreactor metagenome]|uniref:Uncharacterized protein n=1 Tax=bioreactor metagenome TaxID=1076179 RepID=A0A645GX12_9ZZZZ
MQQTNVNLTFLISRCTKQTLVFGQQQYIAFGGKLYLNDLNVFRILFHVVIHGMEAFVDLIENIEFSIHRFDPEKAVFIFEQTLDFTRRNV